MAVNASDTTRPDQPGRPEPDPGADPAPASAAGSPAAGAAPFRPGRGWLRAEVVIVLALSLGQSAVYSLLSLAQALATGPLSEQTAALNRSLRPDPWLDLLYQLLSITFALVPVVLVVALLTLTAGTVGRALRDLGMDLGRPLKDVGWGLALTVGIGLPGLAVYYLGRVLGATVEVVPATLDQHWWTVPVLIGHALKNALVEEVIVVGYLYQRLERLGWSPRRILLVAALLRGAYHTYQGVGPGLANLGMGLVFGEWYRRTRRTLPLVVAHTLIDVFAFVGYALLQNLITT